MLGLPLGLNTKDTIHQISFQSSSVVPEPTARLLVSSGNGHDGIQFQINTTQLLAGPTAFWCRRCKVDSSLAFVRLALFNDHYSISRAPES